MADWTGVQAELGQNQESGIDRVRRKYLAQLREKTGRNVIAYYSGWLQHPELAGNQSVVFGIDDSDKTGFMTCNHELDRSNGLDLILHTPGGDVAATESLIDYLHSLYDGDIRAIVPELAMSGGTLIALSCKEILMGRQSSLGPVDPQINGMPAQGVIEEFERAKAEIAVDPSCAHAWTPILAKIWPTMLTSCKHAVDWSDQLLREKLRECMLSGDPDCDSKIERIAELFGKQAESKTHMRHISPKKAKDLGLNVTFLEDQQDLQDAVLTVHHCFVHTIASTSLIKIVENHTGKAVVDAAMRRS